MLTGCLIVVCLIGFSTFALVTKGNFDTFFGGKGVITSKPIPPSGRDTIIITKENKDDVVIESGYNYIFKGSSSWGTISKPIDLSKLNIIIGLEDEPFDAYIEGNNNYFKVDKKQGKELQGAFGVLSGAIVNFNLVGTLSNSPTSLTLASILEVDGVLYNCNNYINISSYNNDGYSAGLVGEAKGKIIKCNNYGTITANGYASGIAYKVTGSITDSYNYGIIESKSSKAAGIAAIVNGTVKNSQNLANVSGNLGAAGIAIEVNGGSLINCVNGTFDRKISIYSSSAYSVGIVYNLKSIEASTGKISKCINYSDINGNSGAVGIGYYVQGDIEESKNYGQISSYSAAAGIAQYLEGNIAKSKNYGTVIGNNDYSIGLVLTILGNIIDCQNSGYIKTSGGSASGIVFDIEGNISRVKNTGIVQKIGWGNDSYVTGIASKAKGKISDTINNGDVIADNIAKFLGGIAGEMTGQILNSESNGKIIQNNAYQHVTAGGITAVLDNNSSYGVPLIKDCIVTGGLQLKSNSSDKGIIAYSYPKKSIVNCVGMGVLYNL
jgi:hypothetical protein